MSDLKKALSYLSLSRRAGLAAAGTFAAEKALKEKKAFLLILSADISENSRKHFEDMCNYRGVPYITGPDRETLGRSVGAAARTVIAVLSEGLAEQIRKSME